MTSQSRFSLIQNEGRTVNITLVVMCPTVGGSEKRFARLFRYLNKHSRHSYRLILPNGLYQALCEQDILASNDPKVIPLFQRFPASLYSRYPLFWRGVRLKGLNRIIYTAAAREVRSSNVRRLLASSDLVHNVSAVNFLKDVLPGPHPLIQECMDYTLVDMNFPVLREWIPQGVHFNCLSESIYKAYRNALGEANTHRAHLGPGSVVDGGILKPGHKESVILFVGRMSPLKNPILFVEAIAQLADKRRDFKTVMLGTGVLDHRVDSLIRRRGLTDIVTRRFDPHPEEWMSKALIYVSLQDLENYPSQALLEAMACGCAVVASDVGETRRLVTDETGFRVPLDASVLADRLDRLLTNPQQAETMGTSARQRVLENHSIETYADYLEALYEQVAGNSDG